MHTNKYGIVVVTACDVRSCLCDLNVKSIAMCSSAFLD